MIADYHLHSEYSHDSREKIENICKKAIEQGVEEICFTDHVEFASELEYEWPNFRERYNEIIKCQKKYEEKLSILNGVEIGQAHVEIQKQKYLLDTFQFDFVISSVHSISEKGLPVEYPFTADNYCGFFYSYFDDLKKTAVETDFDVLGHVTLPFRYVPQELLSLFPISMFKKEYVDIFKILVDRGKGIEINTSGLRTCLKETLPNRQVLEWYKGCGGKVITVGSDGHSLKSAFSGIEEGYQLLRNTGFRQIAHFNKRNLYFEELAKGIGDNR